MKPRELLKRGAVMLPHSIHSLLRDRLRNGVYTAEEALPGEHALASEFGVSRATLRRALDRLTSEGWIIKRPGVGTFPTDKAADSEFRLPLSSYLAYLTQTTRPRKLKLRTFKFIKTPPFLRSFNFGKRVLKIERTSLRKGDPVHALVSYIPDHLSHLVSEASASKLQMLEILEAGGVRIAHTEISISSVAADFAVAEQLEVPAGSPLIHVQRMSMGDGDDPLEFSESFSRPDRFKYTLSIDRDVAKKNMAQLRF